MSMETIERRPLAEWMDIKGMTPRELARRVDKSMQAVWCWRRGDYVPVNSRAVHRALGLQEGQIIWGKGGE